MKTVLKSSFFTLLLILLTGCFRNNIRTETFRIHQLRSDDAGARIQQALRQVAGIQEVRADLENQTLIVVFNGLECYIKNIEYAIVTAGFDLPNWPADPAAKANLPEELR